MSVDRRRSPPLDTEPGRAARPRAAAHHRGRARARRASCWRARARANRPGSTSTTTRCDGRRARSPTSRARRYPDLRDPVPQPLAPFRGRRRRPPGRARRAAGRRCDAAGRARAQIDLAVVSVLLDAGAGPDWHYLEVGQRAALHPLRGPGRRELPRLHGRPVLQRRGAPAAGRCGRPARRWTPTGWPRPSRSARPIRWWAWTAARCCCAGWARRWPSSPRSSARDGRPGGLFDLLGRRSAGVPPTADVAAHDILSQLLTSLSGIWPAGNAIGARAARATAGATPRCAGPGLTDGWMPFHKLSQWLTYSLLEPFEWAGVEVRGLDALTGLPEYRNGGLLLDTGVLAPARPGAGAAQAGGRRRIGRRVARADGGPAGRTGAAGARTSGRRRRAMPLACVLEGGTWAAGPRAGTALARRPAAAEHRQRRHRLLTR